VSGKVLKTQLRVRFGGEAQQNTSRSQQNTSR